ncbi:hypothetical protein EV122DRAFT_252011 [Schizophyllum commune]
MPIRTIRFRVPSIITGVLFANSFYYNTRLTEYSSYALWTSVLHRLTDGIDPWGVVAIGPQLEVFVSPRDSASDNDPDTSTRTVPDREARGVRIDLSVLLHQPHRRPQKEALGLADLVQQTMGAIFRRICTRPHFDASLYNALSIENSFIMLFVELKRPISRHIPIDRWLERVSIILEIAKKQAEEQFNCAKQSPRYNSQGEAWLIAGTSDVFCVRWVESEDATVFDEDIYEENQTALENWESLFELTEDTPKEYLKEKQASDRANRAAMWRAQRVWESPDRMTEAELLELMPPFSDKDISDFLSYKDAKYRKDHRFQEMPVLAVDDLDKRRDMHTWSDPMRLGSPVADAYLSFIRNDMKTQARQVTRTWGEPISPAWAM